MHSLLLVLAILPACSCLQCYSLSASEELVLTTCPSTHTSCTAIYVGELNDSVRPMVLECHVKPSDGKCDTAQCVFQRIIANLHHCCCDHDGCNPIPGLHEVTLPPVPTPPGPPPPQQPGRLACVVNNCTNSSVDDTCFHHFADDCGTCMIIYRRDQNANFRLLEQRCAPPSNEPVTTNCTLNTSNPEQEVVSCTCNGYLCNDITNIRFTDPHHVVEYYDPDCRLLECSQGCINTGTPQCVCRRNYVLATDGTTCIDVDECALGTHDCLEVCINEPDGYRCGCNDPLAFLAADGRSCEGGALACPTKLGCDREDYACQELKKCDPDQICFAVVSQGVNGSLALEFAGCFDIGSTEDLPCGIDSCPLHPLRSYYHHCCCSASQCSLNLDTSLVGIPISVTISPTPSTTEQPTTSGHTALTLNSTQAPTRSGRTAVIVLPVVGGVVGGVVVVVVTVVGIAALSMFCICRRRRRKFASLTSEESTITSSIDPTPIAMTERIGNGRFAEVFKGHYSDENHQQECAIKKFKTRAWFDKELGIYTKAGFAHPNILKFYCSRQSPDLIIVTEFYPRGSLFKQLSQGDPFSWRTCLALSAGFTKGLEFLHSSAGKLPIAHRDLKSSNLLVKTSTCPWTLVISDFNLAFEPGAPNVEQVGTTRYMPPEMVDCSINIDNKDSYLKIDIFSAAIILWEIMSRTKPIGPVDGDYAVPPYSPPYEEYFLNNDGESTMDKMRDIFKRKLRPTISTQFKTLETYKVFVDSITESWADDPLARNSAALLQCRILCMLEFPVQTETTM